MLKLNFYGHEIKWNGKEIGVYSSEKEGETPKYHKLSVSGLEKLAKEKHSKEILIRDFKKFQEVIRYQLDDRIVQLVIDDFDQHREHLRNAERFFNEVLTALEGK